MDTLLEKVKANLILEHSADDALLQGYITAAVSYAESYQHIQEGYLYRECDAGHHHRTGGDHAGIAFLRVQGRFHGRLFRRQYQGRPAGLEHGQPSFAA